MTAATARGSLRLCARDEEDLGVVAACLQDARVPVREMCFSAAEGRFMAAFTRFQRERLPDPTACEGLTQCHAALVVQHVEAVQPGGLEERDDGAERELLTTLADPVPPPATGSGSAANGVARHVTLLFAGGAAIRLRVASLDCRLEDFDEPWRSPVQPCDHFARAAAEARRDAGR